MNTALPRVTVDTARLDANIRRFHESVPLPIRAHVKAHRVPEVTSRQLAAGATGVAVQFAREARAHLAVGAQDVVLAWPWEQHWRWRQLAELAGECRLAVHVTGSEAIAGLAAAARETGTALGIRIQLDGGAGRGVTPEDAITLARQVAGAQGVRLDGVTGYAALTTPEAAGDAPRNGRDLAKLLVETAEVIRADGHECPNVCAGGTPTAQAAAAVAGVTELCAGAYAFADAGLAELGWCDLDDVALMIEADPDSARVHELLERCHQPWAPDVVARPHRDAVVPAHTCPLMPRLERLAVLGEAGTDSWAVRCDIDREGQPDAAAR